MSRDICGRTNESCDKCMVKGGGGGGTTAYVYLNKTQW